MDGVIEFSCSSSQPIYRRQIRSYESGASARNDHPKPTLRVDRWTGFDCLPVAGKQQQEVGKRGGGLAALYLQAPVQLQRNAERGNVSIRVGGRSNATGEYPRGQTQSRS